MESCNMDAKDLMERALDPSLGNEERYENFEKMYSQYKEDNAEDEEWSKTRTTTTRIPTKRKNSESV